MQSILGQFIKLKRRFENECGKENMWNYGEYNNCIEYWASKFEDSQEMFSPLLINEYNDFVLLRYNLLDSDAQFWKKYDGLYKECRSVVLDKRNECYVLRPFKKFFNLNETEETSEKLIRARINNANSVEISDKLDGSMQSARYYNNQFVLAGTRALNEEESFRLQIGYAMLDERYKAMLKAHPDYTFIFELICKEDQHVVKYTDEQRGLYLIGMRDVNSGRQASYAEVIAMAGTYHVPCTKVFDKTFDELLVSLDDKSSDEAEGFVIDIDGYKVKLKYNDYCTIHKMLSKMISSNAIIKCVDNNTWDDVKSKIPEAYRIDAELIADDVKQYIKLMSKKIDMAYKNCIEHYTKQTESKLDKKSFVEYITANYKNIAHYLINRYNGYANNFIHNKAGRYLKYYEIKKLIEQLKKEIGD